MPTPPIHLDRHTGQLHFSAGVITDTTTPAELPRLLPTATITPYDMGNGWQQYHVRLEQDAWRANLVLWLVGRYFVQWQLAFYPVDTRPRTWADWNEAAERQQAQEFHQWLSTQLGPSDGSWQFDWGEVWVGYDARSGGSSIGVRYGGPAPTPRPA
ncbi:hypothetical protein [Hymenobacter jeollabukensis]|uniref:Uncharacterized protein n=1 Tax=Hymenobacter jeollabukensis TaxID=2025313 RepID=A0A5R8WP23_9BACT|nr:hypothetical protein [Hymenobacter jeollabukensis]TLM91784.1 hypothetical protein FDY95_14585 [Hymenobacter jeollabukensis]